MAIGLRGYFYTETHVDEMVAALDAVAAGEAHFPADVAAGEQEQDAFLHFVPEDIEARLGRLSARERDVMRLLGQGCANQDVAERLHLKPGTVRIYVHRIIRQLGLRNWLDVALCASRFGDFDSG